MPVQERPGLPSLRERVEDLARRQGSRQGHRPASEQLRVTGDVGGHAQELAARHSPEAPETREDLVGDDRHLELSRDLAQSDLERRVDEAHPSGTLEAGLEEQSAYDRRRRRRR